MSKYHNAFQGFVKAFTAAAKPGVKGNPTTIIGVAPSKNIKKFQEQKEKIIKTTDAYKKKVNDPEVKKKMNETTSKTLGKISQILKGKKVEKKAMGGRIGLKGGGNDMGSNLNKSINSLKNILANRKNRKKSKIPSKQEEQKDMALQRVKDRPYNPKDDFDTYKKRTQAMGGDVLFKTGGRIGKRLGGGADMAKRKTNVQKIKETFGPKKNVPSKFKGFSKLPEKVQQQMNKKLAKKV